MTAYLKLDHIDKTFTRGAATTEVLKDINLTIEKGDYVSIIGHSGCGKSTLLNIIAGLEPLTTGEIWIGGRNVTWEEPLTSDDSASNATAAAPSAQNPPNQRKRGGKGSQRGPGAKSATPGKVLTPN